MQKTALHVDRHALRQGRPGREALAVAYGDFDGDGRLDVFVAGHGYDREPFPGESPVLLLSTTGGLQEAQGLDAWVGFFHGAASADVDYDGDLEAGLAAQAECRGHGGGIVCSANASGTSMRGGCVGLAMANWRDRDEDPERTYVVTSSTFRNLIARDLRSGSDLC